MTETKTHTFDWHREGETFLKWALVHFSAQGRAKGKDDELFDRMSDATDRFTNVELKILVSGIEVDAKAFMDHLDDQMDRAVEREAKKLIEGMPRLHELYDAVHDFERDFKERVRQLAAEAGIELDTEGW